MWTAEDAKGVLDELAASGEPLSAFARRRGLVPQRLYWWKKRLAERRPAGRSAGEAGSSLAAFVPMVVRQDAVGATVDLATGVRIELRTLDVAAAEWLAVLLRALGGGR